MAKTKEQGDIFFSVIIFTEREEKKSVKSCEIFDEIVNIYFIEVFEIDHRLMLHISSRNYPTYLLNKSKQPSN